MSPGSIKTSALPLFTYMAGTPSISVSVPAALSLKAPFISPVYPSFRPALPDHLQRRPAGTPPIGAPVFIDARTCAPSPSAICAFMYIPFPLTDLCRFSQFTAPGAEFQYLGLEMLSGCNEMFSSRLREKRPSLFSVSTAPWYFSATDLMLESPVPAGGRGSPEQVFSKTSI